MLPSRVQARVRDDEYGKQTRESLFPRYPHPTTVDADTMLKADVAILMRNNFLVELDVSFIISIDI